MTAIKTKDIKRMLIKKGFDCDDTRDHNYFYYLDDYGKKTPVYTKLSHGKKEIGEPLINIMAEQIKLSKKQFLSFIECSLSAEEYHDFLQKKHEI